MAIRGIGGKPGTGKTVWVIHHLLLKYFEFNKIHQEFFPKSSVSIITNIDNLKLDHYSLEEMVDKAGGVEKFFEIKYQRELLKRMTRIVYIIDEAQKYFPVKFSKEEVIYFFQYHRHLGIDIYLIAPGVSSICTLLVRLFEYRIQASERSKRLFSEFRYTKMVGGETAGKIVLKSDKKIFELYRSMDNSEVEKIGSLTRKYVLFFILGIAAAGFAFYYFMNTVLLGSGKVFGGGRVKGELVSGQKKEIKTEIKNKKSEVNKISVERNRDRQKFVGKSNGSPDSGVFTIKDGSSLSAIEIEM